jgi:hypothetical protein
VNSCLYEGSVRHRRHCSPAHELRHRLSMAYLDLDELPGVFDCSRLWSARGPSLAWFRRGDHLGDPARPLADCIRELVLERTGAPAEGPVRLLTNLRQLGHCFNPVSFYYCFRNGGEQLGAVVAEVTNTPWGERHAYVLPAVSLADHGTATVLRGRVGKEMHVSPLMGMDQVYDWRLTVPARALAVHIESRERGAGRTFDATLALTRREITPRELRRALLRQPLPSVRTLARIYAGALRLRLKGAPYHPHPRRAAA